MDVPFVDIRGRDKCKTVHLEGLLKDLADKASNIQAVLQLLEGKFKKDLLDSDKVLLPEVQHYIYLHSIN